ncbi:MAG: PQQ-binding-like beta-propeller repeat protein [Planctomycetes bacterium]|nr:PQQ-binding-like beta-propeller repeat protein [Planctomycetota bacterium]
MRNKFFLLTSAFLMLHSIGAAQAGDWPNWLGPNRNGSSPETGLLTTWPSTGPKVLWKVPGGDGYSSVAVAQGRAVTLVQRTDGEFVLALDAVKGTELWKTKIGPVYKNKFGNGPRSTPAIEAGSVYVQSVSGPLACLKADTGDIVWSKDLLKDFNAKNLTWGLSASPVIEGDLVLAVPGAVGAGSAAFNKRTGELVWKSGSDKAGYASPVPVTVGGKRQVIFFNGVALYAVSADKGEELWRIPWTTDYDCNIATPLVLGDLMFVASGEHVGCTMYKLKDAGQPEVVWESKGKKSVMMNYWANSVAHEGHLYGYSGQFDERIDLNCVEIKTGKLKWTQKDFGKGSVMLADGHLFMTTKKGDLVLAKATPEKYQEVARVTMLGENRTVPTLANGRLYLRDKEHILCLDVGAGAK